MEKVAPPTLERPAEGARRLRRVLSLRDLVFYGIVLIQPIAPVGIFGLSQKLSDGHVSTTIVLAMVAMLCTAFSYGRMAALYPSAGSAYTYVARGIHPYLGFLAGWAMSLDYLIIPIINTIYIALTIRRLLPAVPYVVWVAVFAALISVLNLRGIRLAARFNTVLLTVMCVVIAIFVALAIRYVALVAGWHGLFSFQPFYDRKTFHLSSLSTATSLAALTYIGFDGVTTLAEDVEDPRRNLLRATVLVCLITGIFSTIEVYLAQRVWPDYHTFRNLETAFLDVTRQVGGAPLFQAMAFILVLACFGSGLTGQLGAARLLFGMGRDGVLPRGWFAYLDKRSNPSINICLIGMLAFVGSLFLSYERAAEILNFGAFLAFMGVNIASLRTHCFGLKSSRRRRLLQDAIVPGLGFLFCLAIWLRLPAPTRIAGGAWLLLGVIVAGVRTSGFRKELAAVSLGDS